MVGTTKPSHLQPCRQWQQVDPLFHVFVPQIVVTTLKIERYNRASAAISEKDDSDDDASPFTGITAATSDSSGDWVVREILRGGRDPCVYSLRCP